MSSEDGVNDVNIVDFVILRWTTMSYGDDTIYQFVSLSGRLDYSDRFHYPSCAYDLGNLWRFRIRHPQKNIYILKDDVLCCIPINRPNYLEWSTRVGSLYTMKFISKSINTYIIGTTCLSQRYLWSYIKRFFRRVSTNPGLI